MCVCIDYTIFFLFNMCGNCTFDNQLASDTAMHACTVQNGVFIQTHVSFKGGHWQ